MPTIKIIDSAKIDIYSREHPHPHFHALYVKYEEFIEIETLNTYIGMVPVALRKKITEWAKVNKDYLMGIFKQYDYRILYLNSFLELEFTSKSLSNRASPKYLLLNL